MIKFNTIYAVIIGILLFSGCKKDTNDTTTTPFRATFQAVVNNIAVSYAETTSPAGPTDHYWSCAGVSDPEINYSDSSLFMFEMCLCQYYKNNIDSVYHNSIFIDIIHHISNNSLDRSGQYPDLYENIFRNFLETGIYPYTFNSSLVKGINVIWYDDKGVQWVSGHIYNGETAFPAFPPDYSRNNFSIVYSQPCVPLVSFYTWAQEVHMTFGCWVYNYYGDSLRIENARLQGIYSYRKM